MPLTEKQKTFVTNLAIQKTQERAAKDAQKGQYNPPTFDYLGVADKLGIPIVMPTVVPDNDEGLDFLTIVYNRAFRAALKKLQGVSVAA